MRLTFLRSVLIVIALISLLLSTSAAYAYLVDERARNVVVLAIAIASATTLVISVWIYAAINRIEKNGRYKESYIRLLRRLFFLNLMLRRSVSKQIDTSEIRGYWLALLMPPIICVLLSLSLHHTNYQPIISIVENINTFWRIRLIMTFSECGFLAYTYNALLFIIAIPQAVFLSIYAHNYIDYKKWMMLEVDVVETDIVYVIRVLSGAFLVVMIFGFLYFESAATELFIGFGLLGEQQESSSNWLLFFIGAVDHLVFVYFFSGWLVFRETVAKYIKSM